MMREYSTADEIADVSFGRPHVVILGAGASLAAMPKGDRNGRRLPLMPNVVEVLGLKPILDRHQLSSLARMNFEELYSTLLGDPTLQAAVAEIEAAVANYFRQLELPDQPTIYDHLVLSLRPKDVVATFNWDPFLFDACRRNYSAAGMPRIIFLHGSVSIGFCQADRRKGPRGTPCPACGRQFNPSRLLYPVAKKNYADDPFISAEWAGLRGALGHAFCLTVFGYGAPASDIGAVSLMKEAWGDTANRELEQTEIIDIKPEDDLTESWSPFIHSHHYDVHTSFQDSWLWRHPRRSCEAMCAQIMACKYVENNLMPLGLDLPSLHAWFRPLTDAERRGDRR